MARINLLPWRETQRADRVRQFQIAVASAAFVAVGIIVVIHLHIEARVAIQERRNTMLTAVITGIETDIAKLKELEKREKLIRARMNVIQELQLSRPLAVQLFDSLARTIPDTVYISAAREQERTLLLTGVAESNAAVSEYLRSLEDWETFGIPTLSGITARPEGGQRLSLFQLSVPRHAANPASDTTGKPSW
jgi:type IV pilus assembly protein PilN